MSDQSTRLGLPYILPSQAQKHVTHNEAVRLLDALVQLSVEAFDAQIPPVLPVVGTCFALGTAPTGDWAGQGGAIAVFQEDGWRFLVPQQGWLSWGRTAGELRVFTAAGWVPVPMAGDEVARLGIGTAPDATNRLAVASPATLLSHDGAGHQLKINKAVDTDTASLLFQSGWSGHAEMGLAGDTAFTVKVSADGVTWSEAMRADPVAQSVSWAPAGAVHMALDDTALQVDVPVTGAAVQATATDTTAGRLMRADYGFGPGNLLGVVAQSGGQPTGAVIEQGSNANGEYVRLADGTQICWTKSFKTASGAAATWVYPAAFALSGSPSVTATSRYTGAPRIIAVMTDSGNASCSVYSWSETGSDAVEPNCAITAVGRWV